MSSFLSVGTIGCHNQEQEGVTTTQNASNRFDLQGHRGCRGLMPENTILAMLHALELGVNTLEMDVSITKDSICILSHEPFFNHEISTTPNGDSIAAEAEKQFNIFAMNLQQVQQFDVGRRLHPRFPEQQKVAAVKPTLDEVFTAVKEWCQQQQKPMPQFNIETKSSPNGDGLFHPAPEAFVQLLMQVVDRHQLRSQTIIQSFDFRTLQVAKRDYPDLRTAALIEDFDLMPLDSQLQKIGFVPAIYSPAHILVNEELVQAVHQKGMLLIPWTVNDTTTANRLKQLGVDGLITDYPDRIR